MLWCVMTSDDVSVASAASSIFPHPGTLQQFKCLENPASNEYFFLFLVKLVEKGDCEMSSLLVFFLLCV